MSYSYSYSTDMNDVATTGLFASLGSVWIVSLIISIVAIVAMWKLFKKAGKPGWASLIPIYNTYI